MTTSARQAQLGRPASAIPRPPARSPRASVPITRPLAPHECADHTAARPVRARCGDVKDKIVVDGWFQQRGAQMHKDFAAALNTTGRPIFFEAVAG